MYPAGKLPEERLVYLLTGSATTIGRALHNDLILLDPTVSREHARLVYEGDAWSIYNVTEHNVLHVNGEPVPAGKHASLQSQDFLMLGDTLLQLIAPKNGVETPQPQIDVASMIEQFLAMPASHTECSQLGKSGAQQATGESTPVKPPYPSLTEKPPATQPRWTPAHAFPSERVDCSRDHMDAHHYEARSGEDKENLFGAGITLQFAIPQRFKVHRSWLISGIVLIILLVGALIAILFSNLMGIISLVQESSLNLLPILMIPIIAALGINFLVNFIDRYEREPWFLRLAAFLWGAVIAIPPTTFVEGYIDTLRSAILGPQVNKAMDALFSALNAGITEETVKGLGLLLLFIILRDEFDNVTDGIVYGALIGAGFAMVENILYFAGNPKAFLILLIGRIVLGWLSHSTFTVCLGIALGYIRHTRVRWQHIVIPLIGYLISVGLHTAFDFINFFANSLILTAPANSNIVMFSFLAGIGDYIPPFIAQMVIVYCLIKSLAHEAAIIREFLTSEVSSGIVTVDEYALLQHSFLRTRIERGVLFHYGMKQWLRVRALYQTEIGLAFRKWHVSMGDKPKLGYLQPEDAYRRRIQRLRQEILQAEAQAPQNIDHTA
ncbi:hypothetical protein KDI_12150 [Dictyobacter arantiisoli]|uniref:FHA domain-containing protein n=2 Tax=Dictyobacter arantiisoli TaxID=2014874 RepID=A0A5A5T856_9CHLR|nr:hypothetical protein KDI_12150 [Dictyobacter arantiisoli]